MSKKPNGVTCWDVVSAVLSSTNRALLHGPPGTGKTFAADTPEMKVINRVWSGTTKGERQAFHAFTCQNSRALHHIAILKAIADKIEDGLRKLRQS